MSFFRFAGLIARRFQQMERLAVLTPLSDLGAEYTVYAVQISEVTSTTGEQYFRQAIYGEPSRDQVLTFSFWVVTNGDRTVLVDTGFSADTLHRRGRTGIEVREQRTAMAELGLDPDRVDDIFVTHLHYDHTGGLGLFPGARVHVDALEYAFWTSEMATKRANAFLIETPDVAEMARIKAEGRLHIIDEPDVVPLPGIRVIRVGGHTPGQQVIVVNTAGGPVVVASDSIHFYEEMDLDRPYVLFTDLPGMFRGYELLRSMQRDHGARILAGHDPLVAERYGTLADEGLPHVTRLA